MSPVLTGATPVDSVPELVTTLDASFGESSSARAWPASARSGRSPADGSGDGTPTALLAAPELTTGGAADPLLDLAPAAFVPAAWLAGVLLAGRRRPA